MIRLSVIVIVDDCFFGTPTATSNRAQKYTRHSPPKRYRRSSASGSIYREGFVLALFRSVPVNTGTTPATGRPKQDSAARAAFTISTSFPTGTKQREQQKRPMKQHRNRALRRGASPHQSSTFKSPERGNHTSPEPESELTGARASQESQRYNDPQQHHRGPAHLDDQVISRAPIDVSPHVPEHRGPDGGP